MRTSARAVGPATVLVMVLAIPGAPAGAADAARTAKDRCGQGAMCVFEHDDWKGCIGRLTGEDKDWSDGSPGWDDCKGTMNDKVSSYVNNTRTWVMLWKEKNRRPGYALCLSPGGSSNDLTNLRKFEYKSFEDRVSSHFTYFEEEPPFMYPDGGGYCETYDRD